MATRYYLPPPAPTSTVSVDLFTDWVTQRGRLAHTVCAAVTALGAELLWDRRAAVGISDSGREQLFFPRWVTLPGSALLVLLAVWCTVNVVRNKRTIAATAEPGAATVVRGRTLTFVATTSCLMVLAALPFLLVFRNPLQLILPSRRVIDVSEAGGRFAGFLFFYVPMTAFFPLCITVATAPVRWLSERLLLSRQPSGIGGNQPSV
jgi:hypothetical protein